MSVGFVNELLIEMSVYVYLREMSVTNKDGEKKYYMSKNLNQTPNLNVVCGGEKERKADGQWVCG